MPLEADRFVGGGQPGRLPRLLVLPARASAEIRDPGGPAAVCQSQCGIGMCSGGLASVWEFSTARRDPHSM